VIAANVVSDPKPHRSALLAHDPSAAERAAQSMRVLTISNPGFARPSTITPTRSSRNRSANVRSRYRQGSFRLGGTPDRASHRLCVRSAQPEPRAVRDSRGPDRGLMASIILGTSGILFRTLRHSSWCDAPSVPRIHRSLDPRRWRRREGTSIPATDVHNEIGILRVPRSIPPHAGGADARARAVHALAEQRLPRRAIASCSRVRSTELRDDARRRAAQRQPGWRDHGL